MTKRRRRKRETRILEVDGEIYLVVSRRESGLVTQRLCGKERRFTERMLDDCHAEIWAHLVKQ